MASRTRQARAHTRAPPRSRARRHRRTRRGEDAALWPCRAGFRCVAVDVTALSGDYAPRPVPNGKDNGGATEPSRRVPHGGGIGKVRLDSPAPQIIGAGSCPRIEDRDKPARLAPKRRKLRVTFGIVGFVRSRGGFIAQGRKSAVAPASCARVPNLTRRGVVSRHAIKFCEDVDRRGTIAGEPERRGKVEHAPASAATVAAKAAPGGLNRKRRRAVEMIRQRASNRIAHRSRRLDARELQHVDDGRKREHGIKSRAQRLSYFAGFSRHHRRAVAFPKRHETAGETQVEAFPLVPVTIFRERRANGDFAVNVRQHAIAR